MGSRLEGRGGGWVAGQFVFGAVVVALGLVGPGWPSDLEDVLDLAGVAVAALGAATLVAGGVFLGPSLTPFPRPRNDGELRQHGIYRFVRHPMYGGAILIGVGWSFATRPVALVATFALGAYLELKSRREEAWLAERYPGYETYRRRTRWKFVPGVR